MVETYIQESTRIRNWARCRTRDHYFLAKADFSQGIRDRIFIGAGSNSAHHRLAVFSLLLPASPFVMKYVEAGFLQGIILDTGGFDQSNYKFDFLRREFLGDVRCLVFDVTPRKGSGQGRFMGRIWVEDQDYHMVRFSGVRVNAPRFRYYFHFDSWRVNMGPGAWLPAYVYTEENDKEFGGVHHAHFKAQTRLWGYNLKNANRQDEMTSVLVEAPNAVSDHSEQTQDRGPLRPCMPGSASRKTTSPTAWSAPACWPPAATWRRCLKPWSTTSWSPTTSTFSPRCAAACCSPLRWSRSPWPTPS